MVDSGRLKLSAACCDGGGVGGVGKLILDNRERVPGYCKWCGGGEDDSLFWLFVGPKVEMSWSEMCLELVVT